MKKAYGADNCDKIYKNGKEPEFRCASRRPGLGYYATEDDKLLRNFGVLCKTSTGTTLKPLPSYIRAKLREKYREEYFKQSETHAHALKEIACARDTDLNYFEYKKHHDQARHKALKKLDKRQDFEI